MTKELKKKLMTFALSAQDLSEAMKNDDDGAFQLAENYPFELSFDGIVHRIMEWRDRNCTDGEIHEFNMR